MHRCKAYNAAALGSVGVSFSARITGTTPVVLDRSGTRVIKRSAPVHISEMIWWFRNIPAGTEAAIAENSTVSPELQPLPCLWLDPGLIVWTSLLPDHQEYWGPGVEGARRVLLKGVPEGSRILLGPQALSDGELVSCLEKKDCILFRTGAGTAAIAFCTSSWPGMCWIFTGFLETKPPSGDWTGTP